MRSDRKIIALRAKYGLEGYAIRCMVLEVVLFIYWLDAFYKFILILADAYSVVLSIYGDYCMIFFIQWVRCHGIFINKKSTLIVEGALFLFNVRFLLNIQIQLWFDLFYFIFLKQIRIYLIYYSEHCIGSSHQSKPHHGRSRVPSSSLHKSTFHSSE